MQAVLSGLSVVTPAALWALLILAIPLAIHLFSRSRGRLVHIGHIDLIKQVRKLWVTEVKLTQWFLLLLRLAIFTLAVLILAGFATAGLGTSSTATIYVTPAWLGSASARDVDALLAEAENPPGSHVFILQDGFPRVDRQVLETSRPEPPANPEAFRKAWPLLSERLSLEHHTGKVTVYTTDFALQFGLDRAALPRDVEWQIKQGGQAPAVHREPLRALVVHAQNRSIDASRIIVALKALKEHRLPGLSWDILDSAVIGETPIQSDWLIYLGDDRLDTGIFDGIKNSLVILTDSGEGDVESSSQFVQFPFYPFSKFRLDRFIPTVAGIVSDDSMIAGAPLLKTAGGSPLLQEYHFGPVRLLRFNSRFAAGWNSLAQQAEFPELLLQLMLSTDREPLRYANARIDPANLVASHAIEVTGIPMPRRSLQGLLAALLVLFWVTERWLSERKNREEY